MIRAALLTAAIALSTATTALAAPTVVTSPEPLPAAHAKPRVFLGGSIDMGKAVDWQAQVIAALADQDVVILNPRRPDWNPAWKPVAQEPEFRRQVEWELAALESADVIVLYLTPGSQAPISLLEMGLHARSGKLVVLCPEGFWRKGNVDITGEKYGVKQVESLDALIAEVKARVGK